MKNSFAIRSIEYKNLPSFKVSQLLVALIMFGMVNYSFDATRMGGNLYKIILFCSAIEFNMNVDIPRNFAKRMCFTRFVFFFIPISLCLL